MSIIDQARRDLLQITTSATGFSVPLIITTPAGTPFQVRGLAKKHHLSIDGDGVVVNSKNASVSIAEDALKAVGYPVRNSRGEVMMMGHTVTYEAVPGLPMQYSILEHFPDEALGLIVFILAEK